jgi:hypothetical protein
MDAKLARLKQQFNGQTAKLTTGSFDNSPIPNGKYVAEVVESKRRDMKRKGASVSVHYTMLKLTTPGNVQGRNVCPFAPQLDTIDGIIASAGIVRTVCGDVLPGKSNPATGEFELKVDAYIEDLDHYLSLLLGEQVEITIKDSKGKPRDDGTPFQSVYIQRGLGKDKALAQSASAPEPTESREPGNTRLPPATRKAVPKRR